jgi:hypothetical protein
MYGPAKDASVHSVNLVVSNIDATKHQPELALECQDSIQQLHCMGESAKRQLQEVSCMQAWVAAMVHCHQVHVVR